MDSGETRTGSPTIGNEPPLSQELKEPKKEVKEESDSDREEAVYCICRTSRSHGFMIQCERCAEWFHGECIQLEKSFAKNIQSYYCKVCISNDGGLQIVFKKKYLDRLETQKQREHEGSSSSQRCGACIGCFRTQSKAKPCENCSFCEKGELLLCINYRCIQSSTVPQSPTLPQKKKAGRPRRDTFATPSTAKSEEDDEDEADAGFSPIQGPKDDPDRPKRGRKKGWRKSQQITGIGQQKPVKTEVDEGEQKIMHSEVTKAAVHHAYQRHYTSRQQRQRKEIVEPPKQCLGPGCIEEARRGSKYCSDVCGKALARERLKQFLPGRVSSYWAMMPQAEVRAAEACREKEETMKEINSRVMKLLHFTDMLERYATSLQSTVPQDDVDEEPDQDGIANCTVCGIEYPLKLLHRHIERCFVKNEKQLSFGGTQTYESAPTRGLFCNEYNKSSDNYCKRLRVMCSEHYKGELERDMKVCGCPKIWETPASLTFEDVFVSPEKLMSKLFCTSPRKDCTLHNRWLQIAMGLIDTERMNILLKLGEHSDFYNALKAAIAARGDVITLMCHPPTNNSVAQ